MNRILVANRGEIALRVLRTCRELGLETVAVYSRADRDMPYLSLADDSICIGEAPVAASYLNVPNLLMAARNSGCDAVHPGYGFLAENADFVAAVEDAGMTFIGPASEVVRAMGDKIEARRIFAEHGLATVPGSSNMAVSREHLEAVVEETGLPVLLKAASGGGGRGMRIVAEGDDLEGQWQSASTEAQAFFGDDRIYVEKYIRSPRHVEFQIFGDGAGRAVSYGSRDCSVQRRYQKLVEESEAPLIPRQDLDRVARQCVEACAALGYGGAGTVEFIYSEGNFYFIEMNTRLQVEHTVTEMRYGTDLVREQIRVAGGEALTEPGEPSGHAIECRINAEDADFRPSPGTIADFRLPGGPGVRVDTHATAGLRIDPYYDSLVAKLVVHDTDRDRAILRMSRALGETAITGIDTNVPLLRRVMDDAAYRQSDFGAVIV